MVHEQTKKAITLKTGFFYVKSVAKTV